MSYFNQLSLANVFDFQENILDDIKKINPSENALRGFIFNRRVTAHRGRVMRLAGHKPGVNAILRKER
ncbi:hypothetical protein UF75_2219 [Desulfosporosinus sp. I2]|uniref:hypothetical protein n=1 Tax=Desulfosporosinus sp. I2 TaxID=1617025 RepID=UPI0005EE6AA4|nr:hypothetical protein [Desulfosporosinus sp. I2]KJR47375.1 hypothetical protein UF75_2219 [Desulfosporosinus sp. I2]